MEENFDITNILAKVPNNELKIFFDRYKEASQEICERFPHHQLQVIYEEEPQEKMECDYFSKKLVKHFYFEGNEVSKEEYEFFANCIPTICKERQRALDEAMLKILKGMRFISDSPDEKMAHLDYIIEILKHGPKSSYELQKRIYDSRKLYGPLVYSLLNELADADIINMRYESESGGVTYGLTRFWEDMYSIMKK